MNNYTNIRGLLVSREYIDELLCKIEKIEQEVIDFLGEEYANKPGGMVYFLQMLSSQKAWIPDQHIKKTYDILIAPISVCFDAERAKGDAAVFVDHWNEKEEGWYIVKCGSEEERANTLKLLDAQNEKDNYYALGYLNGKKDGLKAKSEEHG